MRVDAVVIGAELDGLIAALRLLERGRSVCIAAPGAGSLHYAAGGARVLGYLDGDRARPVVAPLDALGALAPGHPYALAGRERVARALDWFAASEACPGEPPAAAVNAGGVTPAGLSRPVLIPAAGQATFEQLAGRRVAVLRFEGHPDFPAALLEAALRRAGIAVSGLVIAPPGAHRDNAGIARDFDALPDPAAFFARLRSSLPAGAEIALLPALLGLRRHEAVREAARAGLGMPALEVPTLPPSVPGMRWTERLEALLARRGGRIRRGARIIAARREGDAVRSVVDQNGRTLEASAFVLATGGVLMGGLAVESDGRIAETALGLAVLQTAPLGAASPSAALAALQRCGIEVDASFRPCSQGVALRNLFVTGRTLAHWDPSQELSGEGVSIVTGWIAAENAQAQIEG